MYTDHEIPGVVLAVHVLGDILVIEYEDSTDGVVQFAVNVEGDDTGCAFDDLESAVVFAIAYKYEGPSTQADTYFLRMIGAEEEDE